MAQNRNTRSNHPNANRQDFFSHLDVKNVSNFKPTLVVTESYTTSSSASRQPGSRSNFMSYRGQSITKGTSNINIKDGVTMQADGNIVVGATNVTKTKKSKSKATSNSSTGNYQNSPGGNFQNSPRGNLQNESSDTNIKIGDNVNFIAGKSVIIGAKYVTLNDEIDDEEIKQRFYDLMGGQEKFEKGINIGCESESDFESAQIAIRKEPTSVLKICSSICMILWNFNGGAFGAIGTGFLATIPGFEGVVLLTAGHNFKRLGDDEPWDHVFYFKAMDGNEKRKEVVKLYWNEIASRNFSMVTSYKGSQLILKGSGDDLECAVHPDSADGTLANEDLDYCAIFLPGFKTFFKDNNLDILEVMEDDMDVAEAEKLFYVGHPYIGFFPGTYRRENDSQSATLELENNGSYKWTNESGKSWHLHRTGDLDRLRVDEECPYYISGYEFAQFKKEGSMPHALAGPDGELYFLEKEDKVEEDSKALRFSYGTQKKSDYEGEHPDVVKYTLDTKGGASGSPVLGRQYTVKAIHAFWNKNKEKVSGGTKISSVIKDLKELRTKFPNYFINEHVEDFVQEKMCMVKLDNGHFCCCRNPIEIEDGQNALEGVRKAKEMNSCVRVHLTPKDLAKMELK